MDELERIRISKSDVPIDDIKRRIRSEDQESGVAVLGGPSIAWRAAARASDVTDEFITGPPGGMPESSGSERESVDEDSLNGEGSSNQSSVFVVTGRDSTATAAVVAVLRAMGLRVVEWDHAVAKTGLPNPYVGDVLQAGLEMAQVAVIVITPDDVVKLRTDLIRDDDLAEERVPTGQARPNVFYEAGYSDAIGRERTVIVEIGNPKSFSDIAGRHVVKYDGSAAKRNALAERLKLAGVIVDTSGADWLTVGELEPALEASRRAIGEERNAATTEVAVDLTGFRDGLDRLLELHESMRQRSAYEDLSDLGEDSFDLVLQAHSLVQKYAADSTYAMEMIRVSDQPVHLRVPIVVSSLRGLRTEMS